MAPSLSHRLKNKRALTIASLLKQLRVCLNHIFTKTLLSENSVPGTLAQAAGSGGGEDTWVELGQRMGSPGIPSACHYKHKPALVSMVLGDRVLSRARPGVLTSGTGHSMS